MPYSPAWQRHSPPEVSRVHAVIQLKPLAAQHGQHGQDGQHWRRQRERDHGHQSLVHALAKTAPKRRPLAAAD